MLTGRNLKHEKMKYILFIAMMVALSTRTAGELTCNRCSWNSGSTSNSECFNGVGNSNQPSCRYTSDENPYCQTKMTINDGIVVGIERRCAAGNASDFDESTAGMPPKNKCTTRISTGTTDVENSECYFSCNTNNCNNIKPTMLKPCSAECVRYGKCDYISGTCFCMSGHSGATCKAAPAPLPAPATFMSCVQCDQETDSTCPDMTSGTPCSSTSHKYCSTTMVTTFDKKGIKVRSSVTKACSASYVASDKCFISKRSDISYSTDVEYTCVTTCDVNNCNTKLPDGLITGNEAKQPIRCMQCFSPDDTSSCARGSVAATICPSSATHCKSVASYYFSEHSDTRYHVEPSHLMISINRSCSSREVTRDCSSVKVGDSSLNVVTCQETCDTDNCNDGWPVRPKCSQCDGISCATNPPQPTPCPQPYQRYCISKKVNRASPSGYSTSNNYWQRILNDYKQSATNDDEQSATNDYEQSATNDYEQRDSTSNNYWQRMTRRCSYYNAGNSSTKTLTGSLLLTFLVMISRMFFSD